MIVCAPPGKKAPEGVLPKLSLSGEQEVVGRQGRLIHVLQDDGIAVAEVDGGVGAIVGRQRQDFVEVAEAKCPEIEEVFGAARLEVCDRVSIVAGVEHEGIVAAVTGQRVGAETSGDGVVSSTTLNDVVAAVAKERVGKPGTGQVLGERDRIQTAGAGVLLNGDREIDRPPVMSA